jgi:hypothetical protein
VSVRALSAKETDVMKTLVAAVTLILSASTAMAEAPCENPAAELCQKACAVMGAKYVLMHQQSSRANASIHPVRADMSADNPGWRENAERLATIAGLSLDYIDGLTLQQSKAAVAAYCPR